ncbi:MAG: hypothetical protein R3A48_17730 [Polyangiales bacterium]
MSRPAPGGGNVTYALTGTFGSNNAFTGTFTARYSGTGCSDCTMQTRSVTLSR